MQTESFANKLIKIILIIRNYFSNVTQKGFKVISNFVETILFLSVLYVDKFLCIYLKGGNKTQPSLIERHISNSILEFILNTDLVYLFYLLCINNKYNDN